MNIITKQNIAIKKQLNFYLIKFKYFYKNKKYKGKTKIKNVTKHYSQNKKL